MNHKSILCGFWPQSEVFPPEQERPASVRIGLGFSFSWNTFCSVLHGPTGDHSADIFRGHVPRASVAKREGQWRVWCYINTWRKWGKGKILGGLDEFWNAFFPQGISQSTLKKENLKWLLMCVNTHSINTHTCKSRCHTVFLSAGTVKCELGEQTGFLQTFPSGVSGQVKEHLKWLPVKWKGSPPPVRLNQGDMIVWL